MSVSPPSPPIPDLSGTADASPYDLVKAVICGAVAGGAAMAVPLATLDVWQKVLASFLIAFSATFFASLGHDKIKVVMGGASPKA